MDLNRELNHPIIPAQTFSYFCINFIILFAFLIYSYQHLVVYIYTHLIHISMFLTIKKHNLSLLQSVFIYLKMIILSLRV